MNNPEDINEAISQMIAANANGLNAKQVAMALWPDKTPESAKVKLSQCQNPDSDARFRPSEIDRLCEITGRADILLKYLCRKHGFEDPIKRVNISQEAEIRILRQILKEHGIKADVQDFLEKHKGIVSLSVRKVEHGN